MFRRMAQICAVMLAVAPVGAVAQTMTNLAHQSPGGVVITMQMTDGTVMAQAGNDHDWYKLTPDNKGSYVNGIWSKVASLPSGYAPDAMAEAVLADGRLIISGGEYNNGNFAFTNQSAIYDPIANTWTDVTPDNVKFIGDSPSVVLPDGRFLVGEKFKESIAAFDPKTMTWSILKSKNKNDFNAEEGWTLLPDGTFLTYDVKKHPQSELYNPATGKWTSEGSTVVDLRASQNCCGRCIEYGPKNKCYDPPGEVGSATLRPDGTVFATGALPDGENVAHTSVWSPPAKGQKQGKWTPGPDFPSGDDAFDAPSSILPNGNVLAEGSSGRLYEFDGKTLKTEPFNAAGGILMPLPTGEILVGGASVYKSTGTYKAAWAPTVTTFPASVTRGTTYPISGTQFNGLSQGGAFGDEFDSHTNFPLVRITNNSTGHVFYARTHDHSTMGVATGAAIVSTNFDVPAAAETGASKLEVVANGIPSAAVAVTVN